MKIHRKRSRERPAETNELKIVTNRREACAAVLACLRLARERNLPGAAYSGLAGRAMLDGAESRLTWDRNVFLLAAGACETEKAAQRLLLLERDRAVRELRESYFSFRLFFLGAYGEKARARLGFPTRTPKDPDELCRILAHAAATAEDLRFQSTFSVPSYVQVDPASKMRHMCSFVRKVHRSIAKIEKSRRRLKRCLEKRKQAQVALDSSIEIEAQPLLKYFRYARMANQVKTLREALRKLR